MQICDLWQPAIRFGKADGIVTAGSCFAQHIGRALKANGFNWLDAEPAPVNVFPGDPVPDVLSADVAKQYGYNTFSFRTGNIYTTSLLLQWVNWATGAQNPSDEVWETNGRFYDPFRPVVEPNGFGSPEEVLASRAGTVAAVRRAIETCKVFVFTLGLTERWVNTKSHLEYPMCPGTAAGEFDPDIHVFSNMEFGAVHAALQEAIAKIREINPECLFLLTVSPVPLTATASDKHVLVATTYSKSVLRAVAGSLADTLDYVDYFPSYEIISAAPYQGRFFEENQRSVKPEGVAHVMKHFFAGYDAISEEKDVPSSGKTAQHDLEEIPQKKSADDLVCEEEILAAFGPNGD